MSISIIRNPLSSNEREDGFGCRYSMRSLGHSRLLVILVFLLSALYMASKIKHGWIPSDEGTLGLSADYVLHGALPHRDYFEGYTGGLTYINALAFRVFGSNSASMRYMMFLFFLTWVPAVYYVASRFVSKQVSTGVTFLAVAWGPPNYPAPLPSWYNLFFATFGLCALLRYVEVQKTRWLVIAGLCGGISFLFKQIGLYFIAAVILSLLFREQVVNTEKTSDDSSSALYRIFLCTALLIYEACVLFVILRRPDVIALGYFLTPNSVLALVILWEEFSSARKGNNRFGFLVRELAPFLLAAAIPPMLFLIPFQRAEAVTDFVRDVFIMPSKQIAYSAGVPSVYKFVGSAVANAALVVGVFLTGRKARKWIAGLMLLSMPFGLTLVRVIPSMDKAVWGMIWMLVPTLAILGSVMLARRSNLNKATNADFQKLFLILSVAILCSLVQFPSTFPIYFFYVAPLVMLAAAAALSLLDYQPRYLLVGVYSFALLYVVFEVTPGSISAMGQQYEHDTQTVTTNLARLGGIRTFPAWARTYEDLGAIVREHAHGDYIFATPDCPEVYFLYGFRNPTRFFFDYHDEQRGRTRRILEMVRDRHINLVVMNSRPVFSGQIPPDLKSALEQEFPNEAQSGAYEVRWKE